MSYLFDGSADRIQMSNNPGTFPTTVTITAWIKPTTAVSVDTVLSAYGATNGEHHFFGLRGGDVIAYQAPWTTAYGRWTTTTGLTYNVWQGIAVSYDAGSTSNDPILYHKPAGGSIQSITPTETQAPSGSFENTLPDGIWVGGVFTTYNFNGRIAYVRLFNSILSQSEIDAEFGSASAIKSGCMGDWRFQANADDFSGNTRHGTVLGDTVLDGDNPTVGGGGGGGGTVPVLLGGLLGAVEPLRGLR